MYQRPYDPLNPVIGGDEKPKQLLEDSRKPIPMKEGSSKKADSECIRRGKATVFAGVGFKGGKRYVKATRRRKNQILPDT